MSSPFRHLCAALLLAGFSSSCLLAIGTDSTEPKAATEGAAEGEPGAEVAAAGGASEGKEAKPAPESEAAKKKAERKAEKKAREVTYARMELALAEMDAANELRDAEFDLDQARRELEDAQRDLEHFLRTEKPLELEDAQLDLDRSGESALQRGQELEELISMYKKDDFAALTREQVVRRGKVAMEFAQRELELDKKRAADKKENDMANKERDLGQKVAKAKQGVVSAEAKLKKVQSHNELDLMRARHKLEDAERPDDDEDEGSKGGGSKGA